MSDPFLPEGWNQDKIDAEYERQAREHDTLADWEASLPRCGWCGTPVKPYQQLVQQDDDFWHARCVDERNEALV